MAFQPTRPDEPMWPDQPMRAARQQTGQQAEQQAVLPASLICCRNCTAAASLDHLYFLGRDGHIRNYRNRLLSDKPLCFECIRRLGKEAQEATGEEVRLPCPTCGGSGHVGLEQAEREGHNCLTNLQKCTDSRGGWACWHCGKHFTEAQILEEHGIGDRA